MRARGVACSLVLHAAFLWLVAGAPVTAPRQAPPVTQVRPIADDSSSPHLRGMRDGAFNLQCPNSYTGIGTMSGLSGRIYSVGVDTPAERAGLVVGDVLLNGEISSPDEHPVGTRLVFLVERDGVERRVVVVVERICRE